MAEGFQDGEEIAGGLPLPHPDEVEIRSQNARRLARRSQAASLAFQVQRTSGEDLDRAGDTRVVGGTFEKLQAVPERETPDSTGLGIDDLMKLLGLFSFEPREIDTANPATPSSLPRQRITF